MASLRRRREATSPFDAIIPDLFDAVLQPQAWPGALSRLAASAGTGSVHFLLVDECGVPLISELSEGFSEETHEAYRAHYGALDPRRKLVQAMPSGRFLVCHRHFDQAFVQHSEFYQDYLIPSGGRFVAGVRLLREEGRDALLGFNRHVGEEPFDDSDLERAQMVLPLMKRVAQVKQRLGTLEVDAASLSGALDRLDTGVIIVDASARVRHCNRAAEEVLCVADGLHVRGRRLRAHDGEAAKTLERLIAQAAQCAEGGEPHKGGGEVVIRRRRSTYSLLVLVAPLPEFSAGRLWRGEPAVAIYITDPESRRRAPAQRLAKMFGLTPAEARLAAWLATGDRLADAAEIFGVSEYTLRAQLRAIKDKTGTSRLAALVRLLGAVAG